MCALLDIRGLQIRFGAAAAVRAGQIVETGPSRQLLTNPEHAYTKSLLAAVPTLKTGFCGIAREGNDDPSFGPGSARGVRSDVGLDARFRARAEPR